MKIKKMNMNEPKDKSERNGLINELDRRRHFGLTANCITRSVYDLTNRIIKKWNKTTKYFDSREGLIGALRSPSPVRCRSVEELCDRAQTPVIALTMASVPSVSDQPQLHKLWVK